MFAMLYLPSAPHVLDTKDMRKLRRAGALIEGLFVLGGCLEAVIRC
jgi:hypothetical protein